MNRPKIGLQMYTVRDEYLKNPLETLKRVADMGYETIELHCYPFKSEQLNEWLKETGLTCGSIMVSWAHVQPQNVGISYLYNSEIGNKRILIGGAPGKELRNFGMLNKCIETMNRFYEDAKSRGFFVGYHAHAGDFHMVDGMTSWDRIMQGTPDDFGMIIDTGNMLGAGADSIHYMNKYPGRSPVVHLKPYDTRIHSGATMIGEDSFDWEKLVETSINVGGADNLVIEYSNYNRYQPMEAAKLCIDRLKEILG